MRYFDIVTAKPFYDSTHEARVREDELERYVAAWGIKSCVMVPWEKWFSTVVLPPHGTVTLVDCMGDDLSPLRSARMSTGNATGVDETKDNSLRNRLWRDLHTSPFEAIVASFELIVPLFVKNQLDRHRTVNVSNMELTEVNDYDQFRKYTSRNEFSARYSEMPDIYYLPPPERFRRKGTVNKQGSGEALVPVRQQYWADKVEEFTSLARSLYDEMIADGVASELARIVLPQNQYTKIRLQATLLNWFQFLALRLDPHAQEETRHYAEAISRCLQALYPKSHAAFVEYTLKAVRFSRSEAAELRKHFSKIDPTCTTDEELAASAKDWLYGGDSAVKEGIFAKLGLQSIR